MRLCIFIPFHLFTIIHTIFLTCSRIKAFKWAKGQRETKVEKENRRALGRWRTTHAQSNVLQDGLVFPYSLGPLSPLFLRLICPSHEHVNILQTSVQSVKAHAYKRRNADRPALSLLKHSFLTCHCMCLVWHFRPSLSQSVSKIVLLRIFFFLFSSSKKIETFLILIYSRSKVYLDLRYYPLVSQTRLKSSPWLKRIVLFYLEATCTDI